MFKTKLHIITAKTVIAVSLLMSLLASCDRKDLWLRRDQATIDVVIYDIQLELLWGTDWQTQWQYSWDEEKYGKIGYTKPDYVRASIYELDQSNNFHRQSPYTKNFPAAGGRVTLKTDSWYDMLFYNAGTEYTLFNQDVNYEYYQASTRTNSATPVISRVAESDDLGTETTKTYVSYNQPDELFGTFMGKLEVTSDPEAYEKTYDEDSKSWIYLYNIDAELNPYSYIYLIQVMVVNNTDSIGDIISIKRTTTDGDTLRYGASGMTMTGLAQTIDLFTRKTLDNTCSVNVEESDIKVIQKKDQMTLPDGTITFGDIFAARMLTWGLPGINPEEELKAVRAGTSTTVYPDRNKLGIKFYLRNGYTHTQVFDVTDQMRSHPCGGVITVVIDAKNSVSKDELDQKPPQSGGGFNANVENWQNEVNADVTI